MGLHDVPGLDVVVSHGLPDGTVGQVDRVCMVGRGHDKRGGKAVGATEDGGAVVGELS